jgi:hypothetical protein
MHHAPEWSEKSFNDTAALETDFHQSVKKLSLQAGQKNIRGEARVLRIWLIAYSI